ncbi:DUF4258 domain-containing protein [Candidatus Woesearchaeota archaeon]|nr:DUF4258 domain-containing protein [Candidatus Woesearchaeota archaeon]
MEVIFTIHAKERLQRRHILEEEALDAIKHPDRTIKRHGLYYIQKKLQRGTIEVCCEKGERYIKVVSVYWL